MKSLLTPKRRRLTKAAKLHLQVLAEQWHDGSSGTNAMIGLGIRRGMIFKKLEEIALRDDTIPTGIIHVPPRELKNEPFACAMAGFEVDLDKLSVGLPAALAARREVQRRWRES